MRHIHCRFATPHHFEHACSRQADGQLFGLTLTGDIDLSRGDELLLSIFVASCRQRCDIQTTVVGVEPVMIDTAGKKTVAKHVFCKTDAQESVWVEMFRTKIDTIDRVAA